MHQSSSSDTANVERDELKKQLAAALDEKSRLQHERDQARRQTEEHERTVDVQRQMVARLRVMYRHKSCEVRLRQHYTHKEDEAWLAPLIAKTIAEFEAEKRKVT